jgi:hypothetical protein
MRSYSSFSAYFYFPCKRDSHGAVRSACLLCLFFKQLLIQMQDIHESQYAGNAINQQYQECNTYGKYTMKIRFSIKLSIFNKRIVYFADQSILFSFHIFLVFRRDLFRASFSADYIDWGISYCLHTNIHRVLSNRNPTCFRPLHSSPYLHDTIRHYRTFTG